MTSRNHLIYLTFHIWLGIFLGAMAQRPEDAPLTKADYALRAQDYFLHIRATEPDGQAQKAEPVQELDAFLAPYEECFLSAASYYPTHEDMLLKVQRDGMRGTGPIKQFQLRADEDLHSFWGIEMGLEKSQRRGDTIWIPRNIWFARIRLTDANLALLQTTWIHDDTFLHPWGQGYRDSNYLQDGIYSCTRIDTSGTGRITYISKQLRDDLTQSTIAHSVLLSRRNYVDPRSSQALSPTIPLLKQLMSELPIAPIQYNKPNGG